MATLELFLRTLLALGIVLGLLLVSSRLARRLQQGGLTPRRKAGRQPARPPRRRGALGEVDLEILQRRALSRQSSIAVVRFGSEVLLVGTTPQSVQLLGRLGASSGEDHGIEGEDLLGPELEALARDPSWVDRVRSPRTAALGSATPTAWDAFLTSLRERTVRH